MQFNPRADTYALPGGWEVVVEAQLAVDGGVFNVTNSSAWSRQGEVGEGWQRKSVSVGVTETILTLTSGTTRQVRFRKVARVSRVGDATGFRSIQLRFAEVTFDSSSIQ